MAFAVFQCINRDAADNMSRLQSVGPCRAPNCTRIDDLAFMEFIGDSKDMYWWGLAKAQSSSHRVSFLGIDEDSSRPYDKYEVGYLTYQIKTSHKPYSDLFWHRYNELVESFLGAAEVLDFTEKQIDEVCSQCVLAREDAFFISECSKIVKSVLITGVVEDTDKLLGCLPEVEFNDEIRLSLIRMMTHFCYLADTINSSAFSPRSLLRFLFGR